jgi:regulation of enolase protein 1 (concanavalin A-like superfamily)
MGSVVTNNGFSDWGTSDFELTEKNEITFRIVKLGPDFIVEYSKQDPRKYVV